MFAPPAGRAKKHCLLDPVPATCLECWSQSTLRSRITHALNVGCSTQRNKELRITEPIYVTCSDK